MWITRNDGISEINWKGVKVKETFNARTTSYKKDKNDDSERCPAYHEEQQAIY